MPSEATAGPREARGTFSHCVRYTGFAQGKGCHAVSMLLLQRDELP
jgi:hypothetical protein